ncbi:hypothetical protein JBL43_19865 [Aureibaculum sp. A20]|uniref:YokE-like PH domain-containing protein n=1 Tax=Aureibaculum flavum TaxID=2795986 RepID=A0ABS0WX73_9FLAO|nr:hypothetical protein [Aureibaculum flavum]MBJ2176515.1 hypothetical protein [Aureibaculum flavum]
MLETLIGLTILSIIFYILNFITNKKREKNHEDLIEKLNGKFKLFINQTESSTITWGLKNSNFFFNKCDIYLMENALIIFGNAKGGLFKHLSKPIILTNEIEYYRRKFPNTYTRKIYSINLEKNVIKIEFGKKGIATTKVKLKLKNLKDIERNQIIDLVEKNCW